MTCSVVINYGCPRGTAGVTGVTGPSSAVSFMYANTSDTTSYANLSAISFENFTGVGFTASGTGFVVPTSGLYRVNYYANRGGTATTTYWASVGVNAVPSNSTPGSDNHVANSVEIVLPLTAGDLVEVLAGTGLNTTPAVYDTTGSGVAVSSSVAIVQMLQV